MRRLLVTLAALAPMRTAAAQSPTTGAIQGVVTDAAGEALAGVTIIASSARSSAQTAVTGGDGAYKIGDLAPGDYLVTFYYADGMLERSDVHVGVQRVTPVFQKLHGGEVIQVRGRPPAIDPTSTTQGITIDQEALRNLPTPGRSFESALLGAPGAQLDSNLFGISFSGSTSLENQYYVDGVNTTNLTYGTVGSPVINDFIQELEVITGGYNAEYGRSTGAIVHVVTKSGTNKLSGSVFGTFEPGALAAASKHVPANASSMVVTGRTGYAADVGFELGGPIIKDTLWFFVGFAPTFYRGDFVRSIQRQTDCHTVLADGSVSDCDARLNLVGGYADGVPDVDPHTGLFITEPVDEETRHQVYRRYDTLAKLNYAATADQQGQLAFQVAPASSSEPNLLGAPTAGRQVWALTTDVSAKWTSKLRDGRTEIEAVIGWHRDAVDVDAFDPVLQETVGQRLFNASLGRVGEGFGESARTRAGCRDSVRIDEDPYPYITNCPLGGVPYHVGGPGSLYRDREDRRSARIGITQRVTAAGNHELKAGLDVEDNTIQKTRALSGGAYVVNSVGTEVEVDRWIQVGEPGDTRERFDHMCGTPPSTNPFGTTQYTCDYLDKLGDPGTLADGETLNWAAYLRDSWQVRPNFTVNAGVRYEEQHGRFSSFLQGVVDPLTGVARGKNAAVLRGLFAPRLGVLYDWTKVGRSKVYAHVGRFYESIPLAINDVGAADPISFAQFFTPGTCGPSDPRIGGPDGVGCVTQDLRGDKAERIYGLVGKLVAPGLRGQYLDELVGGVELELIDDLQLGLSFQKRWLGSVIDTVSSDGAIFVLANPGEWSADEEEKLERRIMTTTDPDSKLRLERQLAAFRGIRKFDKPQRDYAALQTTLVRRFSRRFYLQAAYTYARTTGDYPGLAPDTGAIIPNASPQHDFVELDPNRIGPLPLDRPHYLRVAGYYRADLGRAGEVTLGLAFRAQSGAPANALGAHWLLGGNQTFLLPRGAAGRTDFEHGLDAHLGYGRALPRGMRVEVFADVFGLYNNQGTFAVDNTYAYPYAAGSGVPQHANAISGGAYEDLLWLKTIDRNGAETGTPISRNPNFKQVAIYYRPLFARFGARLTF